MEAEGTVNVTDDELVGGVASCATMGCRLYDVDTASWVREWTTLMLVGVADEFPLKLRNLASCFRS